MSDQTPKDIIRLIEESGSKGRQYLQDTDIPDKIERLCSALEQAASSHVRHVLCNIFATLHEPSALPCVLQALSDKDPKVVAAAADAVGNCAYGQHVPAALYEELGNRLISLLGSDQEEFVRTAAIYALGLMRFSVALTSLLQALEDEAPSIRWVAAQALANLGNQTARPALESRYSRESHPIVRTYIEKALRALSEG
jgi:HEAT repeat-containing taxis protein